MNYIHQFLTSKLKLLWYQKYTDLFMLWSLWEFLHQQQLETDFLLNILEKEEIIALIDEIKLSHTKNQYTKNSIHFKLNCHCRCNAKLGKLNNLLILLELNSIMNNLSEFDHDFP